MKPAAYSARTDFAVIPISKVPPIPPVGSIAIDLDFNCPILRVTGPNFNPQHPNFAYFAGIGGSADVNVWNRTSTKFCFEDQGTRQFVMGFDPVNFRTFPLYPAAFPQGTFCIEGGGACEFSKAADVLFRYDGLKIWMYSFTATIPPSPILLCDFSTALPGFSPTWQSVGGCSANGKTFAIALSNAGAQGTGTTIMLYRTGKGWRKFDTQTGQVSGQWGKTGTIQSSDRFTIHNVKISPGGDWLIIAVGSVDGNTVKDKHFWNLDTLEMSVVSNFTDGHFTEGFDLWINNGGTPFGQYQSRLFTQPGNPVPEIIPVPTIKPPLDQHPSWNNVSDADQEAFFSTSHTPNPITQPWENEILGFEQSKVMRFCHTFNTGKSPLFSIQNAIGSVSQDGKFMLFCSDWQGQTQGDVFIVPLR
jgi:hypothetical protein